jgi:excisionase family DNA binding protein
MARKETFISTGKAAKLWAVSRDTILKWIKSGKLSAEKTVGGHHRIRMDAFDTYPTPCSPGEVSDADYCWNFHAKDGVIPSGCLECVAFKAKAQNCYLLVKYTKKGGYSGIFCKQSCDKCGYYRLKVTKARAS